ncbi:MOSC domain-containing protein [Tropicibacter sp. S64]|uniref:MOSC domain-containing protein n=1 Tax=Tropicibacter sp. S64 TaxID=3415122 RepID=UPI003C7D675F
MPALIATDYTAEVTWLGVVTTMDREELLSEVRDALDLRFDGIAGSVHGGLTRASCSRVKTQYPKGTEIRNERQLSIVSEEELAVIAGTMGVDALDPARLGASMVIRGIRDFSHVPPSSRLQAPSGATVAIDMLNQPCQFPAKSLRHVLGDPAKGFKPAAEGHRGVTAWVAREGRVAVGDILTLHIPGQRHWQPHG